MASDQVIEADGQTSSSFVSIIGARPGSLDLVTLRALDKLRRAEAIVHDRLITAEVLAQIQTSAEQVYVGKVLGNQSVSQACIHALLIEYGLLGQLSGGERQRVLLARALAVEADVLLMSAGRVTHQGACADAASHRAIEAVFDQRIAVYPLAGQWVALPKI